MKKTVNERLRLEIADRKKQAAMAQLILGIAIKRLGGTMVVTQDEIAQPVKEGWSLNESTSGDSVTFSVAKEQSVDVEGTA